MTPEQTAYLARRLISTMLHLLADLRSREDASGSADLLEQEIEEIKREFGDLSTLLQPQDHAASR